MATYKWFVEPRDDFTNEVIAREASDRGFELFEHRDMVCGDGKCHNLWECPHSFITELRHSGHPVKFVRWGQEGNGKIQYKPFPSKKPKITDLKRASEL